MNRRLCSRTAIDAETDSTSPARPGPGSGKNLQQPAPGQACQKTTEATRANAVKMIADQAMNFSQMPS
jgi:hypothetical protein